MQLPYGLTPKQAATVAFISAFVTVIGGLLLALWFRHKNRKGNICA
jgi:ABC-type spermidine/putrescine transport system permease subunit II